MSVKNNPFLKNMEDEVQYCAGCKKDVWSGDRVLALDLVWHKGCLKCTECSMTLSVRMLESYQKKPYCRAHRPNAKLTQVTDSLSTKIALNAPKPGGKTQGVNKTARMTFMPGQEYQAPDTSQAPHSYNPSAPKVPHAATRVQGINKTSNMAFTGGKADSTTAAGYGNAAGDSVEQDYGYGAGGYEDYQQSNPAPAAAAPAPVRAAPAAAAAPPPVRAAPPAAAAPAEDDYGYGGADDYSAPAPAAAEEEAWDGDEYPAAAEEEYPAAAEEVAADAGEGGYYAEDGQWVDTTGAAEEAPAADEGGYYDEAGEWIDTSGAAAEAAPAAEEGGYYDENNEWVDTSGGYYDENNQWVDTSGGYYDDAGNWIDA